MPAAPGAVRCSLREVKGISDAEVTSIVAGQPYTSLRDFWNRAGVSRPVAERLVLLGAFDSLYTAPADAFSASPGRTASGQACPAISGHASTASPDSPVFPGPPNFAAQPRGGDSPRPLVPLYSVLPGDDIRYFGDRGSAAATFAVADLRSPEGAGRGRNASVRVRPSRRDLLARVGVLARQSPVKRPGPPVLDLFAGAGAGPVDAETGDGMADLVPAGQLRDLDLAERVETELEILGFEVSQHVMSFYADLLAGLGVVSSARLADQENGAMILVAGAKVATQTPAVRSGQRIIFASLDDAVGLVDLAFFESVQDRCAARIFGSWLVLVRGRVRRAGAGPVAVTVNGCECWDLPALEEIRVAAGLGAVRAAMAAGDVGPGTVAGAAVPATAQAEDLAGLGDSAPGESSRPITFANGFVLSPYAETGAPGGNLKHPSRTLWHASPGSTAAPAP